MPIFHTFYASIKALTSWYVQCPKTQRYAVGNTILPLAHQILGLLVRTNAARGYKRLALMQETSAQLDLLKIFVRLAKDTHAMTDKNYIQLQGHLNETGKMLGGWIKAQATGTKRPPMNTEDDRGM